MTGILIMVGTTIGGWLGWALAERFGIFAAFLSSLVGTAVGLYYGRKLGLWVSGR